MALLEERRIDYQIVNIEEVMAGFEPDTIEIEVDEKDGEILKELVVFVRAGYE